MGLDPRTEERLREMFGAHQCCRCGDPATRLVAGQFFCHAHFLSAGQRPIGKSGRRKPRRRTAPTAPPVSGPAAAAEGALSGS